MVISTMKKTAVSSSVQTIDRTSPLRCMKKSATSDALTVAISSASAIARRTGRSR